ncbi:hypothetical protein ABEB36_003204 [Hypothenemus hampei]|uniref:von Hippel-Lindau disease tumour suppressor beta domain-containing protein n=1 Tax=Hypothenemus hampei TaxID=57062 RepID=A0ABD1F8D8_HYPHA
MNGQVGNSPRALQSLEKCYVRFINNTERDVEVLWIDYTGRRVQYRTMKKGEFLDVNTFKTHPFIAKDVRTRDMMHICGVFSYYPKTSREIFSERFPGKPFPENYEVRVRASITIPIYSLRFACLLAIREYIRHESDVENLGLPVLLKDDLLKVISKRRREDS